MTCSASRRAGRDGGEGGAGYGRGGLCQLAERRGEQPPLLVGHPTFLGRQYLDGDMVGAGFEVLADSSDDRVDVTPRNQGIDEGVAAARRS